MPESRVPDLSTVESPPPDPDLTYNQLKDSEVVDSGGQAIVRRVSISDPEPNLPETVAVKEPLAPTKTVDRETIEAFLQEAKTWQTLARRERQQQVHDTDHIVGVVAIGDDAPWIAMEYMEGGSLADRLELDPNGLPLEQSLWIGECLCKGVKLAHDNGVAHLDLKPANVLFRETQDGLWDVPKIADWGLSRTLLEDSRSMEMFSPEYAAPEQFDSEQFGRPDKYTDLYQLGALIYELLTGRPPYTGSQANIMHEVVYGEAPEPPSTHREAIPSAVDDAVMQALETDKSQRFRGSVDRFEEALQKNRTCNLMVTSVGTNVPTDVSSSGGVSQRSDEWPMYQGGPARTGYNSDSTAPRYSVTQKWQFETGGMVYSSPAVVDGTVYVGSGDNNLYAIGATGGTLQWQFETGGWVKSSPAVVDGTVYVGSRDNHLYALDATDGSLRWQFETDSEVSSSPAVVDGTVYVGSDDHYLYAIDATDGSLQWQFDTDNWVDSSPAVVDGTVYVGCDDHKLYAVDATDGTLQWQFEVDDWVDSSPAVVDGTVYVGSRDNHLYAVDAIDGSLRWKFETDSSVESSPVVFDGTVYVGSYDNHLYAVDATDGTQLWQFGTDYRLESSPVVVDGTVYVGSEDNHLYALDATNGTQQWQFKIGDSLFGVDSSPAVVDGTVYVGSANGNVYALSGDTAPARTHSN